MIETPPWCNVLANSHVLRNFASDQAWPDHSIRTVLLHVTANWR